MNNEEQIPENWVDVTPKDSGCPVYRIELTEEEQQVRQQSVDDAIAFEQELIEKVKLRESALKKLAKLGLTEDEAKVIIGM